VISYVYVDTHGALDYVSDERGEIRSGDASERARALSLRLYFLRLLEQHVLANSVRLNDARRSALIVKATHALESASRTPTANRERRTLRSDAPRSPRVVFHHLQLSRQLLRVPPAHDERPRGRGAHEFDENRPGFRRAFGHVARRWSRRLRSREDARATTLRSTIARDLSRSIFTRARFSRRARARWRASAVIDSFDHRSLGESRTIDRGRVIEG